jgi:hypothetical protein
MRPPLGAVRLLASLSPFVAPLTIVACGCDASAPPLTGASMMQAQPPSRVCEDALPLYAGGVEERRACRVDFAADGLTAVDLSDDWVPRLFRAADGVEAPAYRTTYLELADERGARHDRFLEPYGIVPTFRVLAARLIDVERHECHARVESSAISALGAPLEPMAARRPTAAQKAALAALEARLVCERLLPVTTKPRPLWRIQAALEEYQRAHMINSRGILDGETRRVLAEDPRELDFRALLRALRARVADATGVIEDGSAAGVRGLVLGRRIDGEAYVVTRGGAAVNGAPDLLSPMTETAARALGWTDPAAAAAFFQTRGSGATASLEVALALPPAPDYHAEHMDLRAEIDRGDVWYTLPGRRGRIEQRPTLTLFARTTAGEEIALIRWPTTIGGWKKEQGRWGRIGLRYKNSDVGKRVWRDLIAAPAWLPPAKTPPRTLVHLDDMRWEPDRALVGPGYGSAYGLVMLVHHHRVERLERGVVRTTWYDNGIRTHGTVSYPSVLRGESHGCHRLFNQSAVQLASFLLQHRGHLARGTDARPFTHVFSWQGRRMELPFRDRGYVIELTPPVEVEVLKGRVRGNVKRVPVRFVRSFQRASR